MAGFDAELLGGFVGVADGSGPDGGAVRDPGGHGLAGGGGDAVFVGEGEAADPGLVLPDADGVGDDAPDAEAEGPAEGGGGGVGAADGDIIRADALIEVGHRVGGEDAASFVLVDGSDRVGGHGAAFGAGAASCSSGLGMEIS